MDKNFDNLAGKFSRKVYGGLKGQLRLAVLKKDLLEFIPTLFESSNNSLISVLDAGCGHAPFSLDLAQTGHSVTLCDISEKMIASVKNQVDERELFDSVTLINNSIQYLKLDKSNKFDLILCHAVIEWLENPEHIIELLTSLLNPGGHLSITFYNIHGMIYKNLLRTNYKKIIKKQYQGWPGSLTPTYPRDAILVKKWLNNNNLEILCHSGMRVFYDYILNIDDQKKAPETVIDLELEFSRQKPYRDMGRYQHILCCKKE